MTMRACAIVVPVFTLFSSGLASGAIDPNDPTLRLVLLPPGGPVVVEASITIDDLPFRMPREKLIEEMLAHADVNKDGKPTWAEAILSPRFLLSRYAMSQPMQFVTLADTNKDTIVDRSELHALMARYFQGGPILLSSGSGYGNASIKIGETVHTLGQSQADLGKLLDVNSDGLLSPEEIAGSVQALARCDRDGDDLIYPEEVGGPIRQPGRVNSPLSVLLFDGEATPDAHFATFKQAYADESGAVTPESFRATPDLFNRLDADRNGRIDIREITGLAGIDPTVRVRIRLGDHGEKMVFESDEPGEALSLHEKSPDGAGIFRRPGSEIGLLVSPGYPVANAYQATAKSYLQRFDKDKNGYLEKSELSKGIDRQFDNWDVDGDGKVFEEEILESYTRMLAPQQSQIRLTVHTRDQPFFEAVDETGDGRLSVREVRNAAVRLLSFDTNKDGKITPEEMPVKISVVFSRGFVRYAAYPVQRPTQPVIPASGSGAGPAWFVRMDRNGDGDVTPKEFPGTAEQFSRLDTNADGFLERSEAESAEK